MNEETTNLETTMDPAEGEDLFTDDSQPQDDAAGEGAAAEGTQEEPQESDQKPTEPTYKVKFKGKEQDLPVSLLITLAQKGMNYDIVFNELNTLKTSPEIQLMDMLAKENGMTRQQYVQELQRSMEQRRIQEQVANGVPEEVARRLSYLEARDRANEEARKVAAKEAERRKQFADLAAEYPDIKDFPQEVIQAINNGAKPLDAYRAYDLQQKTKEIEMLKKQLENRRKTPGSASSPQGNEEHDLFLEGLMM